MRLVYRVYTWGMQRVFIIYKWKFCDRVIYDRSESELLVVSEWVGDVCLYIYVHTWWHMRWDCRSRETDNRPTTLSLSARASERRKTTIFLIKRRLLRFGVCWLLGEPINFIPNNGKLPNEMEREREGSMIINRISRVSWGGEEKEFRYQ